MSASAAADDHVGPGLNEKLAGEIWGSFGDWLALRRLERGLTKRAAAALADVSASTWTTLEAGGRTVRGEWVLPSPSDLTLVKIARSLRVDPYEVFGMLERPWDDRLDPIGEHSYEPMPDDPSLSRSVQDEGARRRHPSGTEVGSIDFNSAMTNVPDHIRRTIEELVAPYLPEDERPG